jgi:hypothetical protein
MKRWHTTFTPDHVSNNHRPKRLKSYVRLLAPTGKHWQRILAAILMVSMVLISPIGSISGRALAAPVQLYPGNGWTITVDDAPPLGIPEFEWQSVVGAASYRIQISSSVSGFDNSSLTPVNIITPNTTYTPTSVTSLSDGTWYWRVKVENPNPSGNYYSSIWSFTKQWATPTNFPTLISPANGSTIDFYDYPVFSWSPVVGAARYKVQIYTSPGGWVSATTATTLATTYQPTTKFTNGLYYWRVIPLDPGTPSHEGTPSAEHSFTTNYNPTITLLAPDNYATPTFTPTFRWTAVRGAQFYKLQYSTDSSFSSYVTSVDTRNTSYTPTTAMPNDQNFYWRVRVHSGNSISDWTPSRTFVKRWYIKPVLLTPTNNFQDVILPNFSWTPVPGASNYKFEISKESGFGLIFDSGFTANTFFSPSKYDGVLTTYYWRVTPYDGNQNAGLTSSSAKYVSDYLSVAPDLIYPLYYYTPNSFSGYPGVATNPYEDRTVPLPIFLWHRLYSPAPLGTVYAEGYRLQVSTDPTFETVDWAVDTENTVAAPEAGQFTPVAGTDYFWHVRPLIGGVEAGDWSQRWLTHIDLSRGLTPTEETAPVLIRPTDGYEFAESTPLLEWFPKLGATTYDVEISLDEAFGSIVDSGTVDYPAYSPTESLAQRSLGATDFGVYYWRVRESPGGTWSKIRRFQISAQSQWQQVRTTGDAANRLQIGTDPSTDIADPDYDLTTLQVSESAENWYFGFHIPPVPTKNVTYGLYLDLDHTYLSGATFDARSFNVTTIADFQPEYAIYLKQEAGIFSPLKVYIYRWLGSSWDTVIILDTIGGEVNQTSDYVEIAVPNTAIGDPSEDGSYAISLFSLPVATGSSPQDTVPSDPNVPGTGPISRFANVTERMNILYPPNNGGADPYTYPTIQPFYWDYPILAPWSGGIVRAYLDPEFTNQVAEQKMQTNASYWAWSLHAWPNDMSGDNTYYWRVQPDYNPSPSTQTLGAWSQGGRFERVGFIPQNLQTSVSFATPTFSWDMVEGADSYELQVDDDPNFGLPAIGITTDSNSYTHINTLAEATYYWRVRVKRYNNAINNWSTPTIPCPDNPLDRIGCFTLELPQPAGLYHLPGGVVGRSPTLCWEPLIVNSPTGDPILAAWKYRIQVSKDPLFSLIYETVDTEQSCWTPTNSTLGYDDGPYYWHVAMLDGEAKPGQYSDYEMLTKQYPVTMLVSPLSGSTSGVTPTFVWTPVNGAARYKLEVSLFDNFSTPYDTVTTDNTRYTPTKTYLTNRTYYWRVAIVDYANKVGPYTNATIILDLPYGLFLPYIKKR